MVPTVLEALGLESPTAIKGVTQSPIEGHSFAHLLDDAAAPSRHITQYFEMMGHRAVYHDGWRAVCPWPGSSFKEAGQFFGAPIDHAKLAELDATGWELYHVAEDVAENHNVASENRARLIEMVATWYAEAGKYNVLPIDSRGVLRFADERPRIAVDRSSYTVYPGTQPVPANAGPNVLNRPHSITAEVDVPEGGAEGTLLSAGDVQGGYSFYVQDGRLQYVYNYVGSHFSHVESTVPVPTGRHQLRFEFEVTGEPDVGNGRGAPGRGQLYIDGTLVGQAGIPLTMPLALGLGGGIVCGADTGSPVWDRYQPPFRFSGTLFSVTVDVSGDLIPDDEAAMQRVLARQ
jgi:arylsulfatase